MKFNYSQIPGGSDLLTWCGEDDPSFHDGEIVQLDLRRNGESRLSVHWWRMKKSGSLLEFSDREAHAVINFVLTDIVDLQLTDFSPQNVIVELNLDRSQVDENAQHFPGQEPDMCWKIELGPCFGIHGTIKARGVRVEVREEVPADTPHVRIERGRSA